jgi:hypothetical protein
MGAEEVVVLKKWAAEERSFFPWVKNQPFLPLDPFP